MNGECGRKGVVKKVKRNAKEKRNKVLSQEYGW
jgi:hypothetical protein